MLENDNGWPYSLVSFNEFWRWQIRLRRQNGVAGRFSPTSPCHKQGALGVMSYGHNRNHARVALEFLGATCAR
jgi:hypothetical protein